MCDLIGFLDLLTFACQCNDTDKVNFPMERDNMNNVKDTMEVSHMQGSKKVPVIMNARNFNKKTQRFGLLANAIYFEM